MRNNRRTTPAEAAKVVVVEQQEVLARCEADRAAAMAELESVQVRVGEEVLDDPAAAEEIPRVMQQLRDRIYIAERTAAAQLPRLKAAELAYLAAEAKALEPAVERAEKALARHEARTRELLGLLEQHEGRFVPEFDLLAERWQRDPDLTKPPLVSDLRSDPLRTAIEDAKRPLEILQTMAQGRDPQPMVATWGVAAEQVYPACVWGPDAVVPAPAYVDRVARERTAAEAQDARDAEMRRAYAVEETLVVTRPAIL